MTRARKTFATTAGVCALVALLAGAAGAQDAAPEETQWGSVEYKLPGNVNSKQGTLICHFRLDEAPDAKPGSWAQPNTGKQGWYRFIIADLQVNGREDRCMVFVKGLGIENRLWALLKVQGEAHALSEEKGKNLLDDWKAGQFHVVAYTWNEKGVHTIWADGKEAGRVTIDGPAKTFGAIDATKGRLDFGSRSVGSAITAMGIHVLDHALSAEQLAKPADQLFTKMDGTLLLDLFDCKPFEPDIRTETTAKVISKESGRQGGRVVRAGKFVETERGQGLQLYVKPE